MGLGLGSLVGRHKVLSFAIESLQSNEKQISKIKFYMIIIFDVFKRWQVYESEINICKIILRMGNYSLGLF